MKNKTYELVRDALAKPGCVLCRLEKDHIKRYLDGFMYEDVTDVGLRAKMRTAQGFCREHAVRAIQVRDSLGLAIIYQDILSSMDKEMRAAAAAPRLPAPGLLRRNAAGPGQRLAQQVTAQRSCPACTVRDEMSEAGLQTLVKNILDPELGPLYQASNGLCLPHFRRALALSGDAATLDALVSRQSQVMNSLVAELAEFIRKHDYRFRKEAMAGESDSWRRAIEMVVGALEEE